MKLLIAMLSLASAPAFAMTTTYQTLIPEAGQSEIKLGVGYRNTNAQGNGLTVKSNGPSIPVSFYYGLTENQSLGIEAGYASSDQETSNSVASAKSKSYGMSEVFVGYKGNFDVGTPTIFVKIGADIPPEKMKKNWDNGETNTTTGQLAFVSSLGFATPVSNFNLGVIGQYKAHQDGDGEIVSSGITNAGKIKGGSEYQITAFGEVQNSYHTNISLSYERSYTSSFTSNNGNLGSTSGGLEAILVAFNIRYEISPGIEFIPTLTYGTLLKKDELNVSQYDSFLVGVEGRFSF